MFEIYDAYNGLTIDKGLTLEWAIEMLRYYHANRKYCSYGIRPSA